MEKEKIFEDYRNRETLVPQDVVKCCLKLHQVESGDKYYDCRKSLWHMKPGDVIFTNGAFHPLVSYPRIDDTLKGVKCGHVDEELETKKRRAPPPKCDCRKWYIYYKADDGKMRKTYPPFDGMTMISGDKVSEVLCELKSKSLVEHFVKGYVDRTVVKNLLVEIRSK